MKMADMRIGLGKIRNVWANHTPFTPMDSSMSINTADDEQNGYTIGDFAYEALLFNREKRKANQRRHKDETA